MIKILISDMDGTLFAGHGKTVFDLTQRNNEALERIKHSGMKFYVASGRMIGFGIKLLKDHGFTDIKAGGFNGAVVYDNGAFPVSHSLSKDLIREIVHILDTEFPDYDLIQVQGMNSERVFNNFEHPSVLKYREQIAETGIGVIPDFTINDFLSRDTGTVCGKLSIVLKDKEQCDLAQLRIEKAAGKDCFTARSGDRLLELGNAHASKGVFAAYLKETLHLEKEEIACIGDELNDAEMYPYAGVKFAMESGRDAVKEMSDYVVKDVAEAIDICLKLNEQ
ncbi:MAG: HAD family phosphatase [Solobacterium sp.]|nr:HAD family phosphatase [Solobacterium sp.]